MNEGRRAAGSLAAEVLSVLHEEARPLTPADVRIRLGSDLAYSTVVTILSRLYGKGLLVRTRRGRAYAYEPVADEAGLVARRMHEVLAHEDDREAVLSRFVSDLSPSDEVLLRRLLGSLGRDAGPAGTG